MILALQVAMCNLNITELFQGGSHAATDTKTQPYYCRIRE